MYNTYYEAPDPIPYDVEERGIIFLAGGITDCENWQEVVIRNLAMENLIDTSKFVLANPRRAFFQLGDKDAAIDQIAWEFEALNKCDIFSMYFARSESVQPICMYELGRNVLLMQNKYRQTWKHRIVVSVEKGYKRANDVNIQMSLLGIPVFNNATSETHAQLIARAAHNISSD